MNWRSSAPPSGARNSRSTSARARPGSAEAVLATGGELDDVPAAVLRAAMPHDQTLVLERVDKRHHRGAVDAQLISRLLLRQRSLSG